MTENQIGKIVVDATIAIHKALGSGLYEIVYEVVLTHELKKHGINIERQVPVSIEYDGIKFDEGFRADIIIESKVILELKSVESVQKHIRNKYCISLRSWRLCVRTFFLIFIFCNPDFDYVCV